MPSGHVDDEQRALIRLQLRASQTAAVQELVAWVDTAFTGGLTVPRAMIAGLGLSKKSSVDALLADGQTVELETFVCYLDWFASTYRIQVIASDARYPLLGTSLLADRKLTIDYPAKTVELVELVA